MAAVRSRTYIDSTSTHGVDSVQVIRASLLLTQNKALHGGADTLRLRRLSPPTVTDIFTASQFLGGAGAASTQCVCSAGQRIQEHQLVNLLRFWKRSARQFVAVHLLRALEEGATPLRASIFSNGRSPSVRVFVLLTCRDTAGTPQSCTSSTSSRSGAAAPAARRSGHADVLGFGYPSGQQSTRSLGTGGALGEIDPMSSSNPAALLSAGGSALYFQAEPEYRTLSNPASSQRTSIARYPLVVATIPIRSNLMLGLSFSNFLDRTFETTSRGFQQIGDSTLATANSFKSDGAIGDVRVALAWAPLPWMHIGAAAQSRVITASATSGLRRQRGSPRWSIRRPSAIRAMRTRRASSDGRQCVSLAASYRKGGGSRSARRHDPDQRERAGSRWLQRGVRRHQGHDRARVIEGQLVPDAVAWFTPSRITDKWDTSVGADVLGPRMASGRFSFVAAWGGARCPSGSPRVVSREELQFRTRNAARARPRSSTSPAFAPREPQSIREHLGVRVDAERRCNGATLIE